MLMITNEDPDALTIGCIANYMQTFRISKALHS
uniref:Uncharacterized protein n=1 Tax=Rhizophora mucronata TaxID=61149 RepID=A0A2P2NFG8_RHIMU